MAGDRDDGGTAAAVLPLVPMALLLCALSYGTDAQGAFYDGPYHVFVILIAAALLTSIAVTRVSSWITSVRRHPVVLLAAALSAVTVLSSVVAGQPADAIGTVSLLLAMACAVAVVASLTPEHRRFLVAGVVVIAVIVAVVGWAAVVARHQPDALTSQGLWRAASTLTYENALAALLTAPALLCLDRLLTKNPSRLVWSGAAYLLLVGIGASLSRGGLLGLIVGVAVLAALRGPRSVVRLLPAVVGAMVALVCLAPGIPAGSSPHVALAYAGLALGAAVAAWASVTSRRLRLGAAVVGAVAFGVLASVASIGHVAREIAQTRASAASSDRAHEWTAAFHLARQHLLFGVGTARVLLHWEVGAKVFTASFAHNELLQLLTQDGIAGLAVVLVGLLAVFVRLARRRHEPSPWPAVCAIACLAALLVQSSLDFLWHLPVIPVLMAVVLALSLAPEPTRGPEERPEERPEEHSPVALAGETGHQLRSPRRITGGGG
ncbi:MAG TPA: O-antigen ligase family protein [Acidimicrobiales bacterium]|nr:O-antigen ligase family protein [Acidimicrobiales bacterium]